MTLTHTAQKVPDVEVAGDGAVAVGSVYVADGAPGALTQVVSAGQKVVLAVGNRTLELTTSGYLGEVGQPGTYVNSADAAGIAGESAKMRLYGWSDRRRKAFSAAGVLVWLPGIVGLLLAISGAVFLSASAPTGRATVADAAKDVQAWVVNPPPTAPASPTARFALANRCLDGLAGREISEAVQIDGVECKPAKPSWLKNKDNAALITTIGGVITAALGLVAAVTKLTFGHAP